MEERIVEAVRVHKTQLVDFNTVKQRHLLWYKLTSPSYLTLFPCRHILPILCTYWNNVKYVAQMLWERMFHPPMLSPQVCVTMKLAFYLPQYQIHYLYQLESQSKLSSIPSLKNFRDRVRTLNILFDSLKDTDGIINAILAEDKTMDIPTLSTVTPRTSRRLHHPLAIREKGMTDITHWNTPTTGDTP